MAANNYIQKLQADNADLNKRILAAQEEIFAFSSFLQTSPKFQGTDSDGDRKDWIAVQDVLNRLSEIRQALTLG